MPSPEKQRGPVWIARQHGRERQKLIGLIVVLLLILALTFARFGRTISWGAR